VTTEEVSPKEPEFVIIGNRCWGRGTTQDAAKAELRKAGGRLTDGFIVFYFDGVNSTFDYVDKIDGSLCYFGDSPVEIARRKPQKRA
jgi:hypothetical protein